MSTPKKLALAAFSFAATFLLPILAFAQDDRSGSNSYDVKAWAAAGAGIAIGLGVLGGALGQGRAAAAALEGISRNPGASAPHPDPDDPRPRAHRVAGAPGVRHRVLPPGLSPRTCELSDAAGPRPAGAARFSGAAQPASQVAVRDVAEPHERPATHEQRRSPSVLVLSRRGRATTPPPTSAADDEAREEAPAQAVGRAG